MFETGDLDLDKVHRSEHQFWPKCEGVVGALTHGMSSIAGLELGRVSVSYSGTIGICLKMTPTIGIGICFELSRVQQIVLE